jgi:hypothetical protein
VSNQATERGDPLVQGLDPRVLQQHLDATLHRIDPEDVDRSVADDVVRDVHAIRCLRIARFGNVHARIVLPTKRARNWIRAGCLVHAIVPHLSLLGRLI